MKKSSCLHHKAERLDIWYEASSSGPLPSLFHVDSWGQKWPHRGHMLYIGLDKEKDGKIFLCETIRPRAMIFGM